MFRLLLILFLFAGVANASLLDDYCNAPVMFVQPSNLFFGSNFLGDDDPLSWYYRTCAGNDCDDQECIILSNPFPKFGGVPQTIMCIRTEDSNPFCVTWEREFDWDVYYTSKWSDGSSQVGEGIKVQITLRKNDIDWWKMNMSIQTLTGDDAIYFTGETDINPHQMDFMGIYIDNQQTNCYCKQPPPMGFCSPIWSAATGGYAHIFLGGNFRWPLFCQLANGWNEQTADLYDVADFCDMWLLEAE